MKDNSLLFTALRRQMTYRRTVDQNIHNLAWSLFKKGTKIQYRIGARDFFGVVIEVTGAVGVTHVVVENVGNPRAKRRKVLSLDQITGLVQEN